MGSGRIKGNNFYYATMLNTMCFAIKKGVLMDEAKDKKGRSQGCKVH